ncbi:ATP-binding protein [Streptacidiphilus sp. PB12-B1b]|uniref:ATP-binding protein n=1 Tax=Streptacidiphilus sp. PB12-B1b TaxID=2705012 RepID=UPI0015F9D974|nr:ATP-binding protein [Streptacidiphilus sp. PB12-B1b]QMU79141.1 ATP-binding protein [Streptacidiphilus sp. PB12-B1b]
MNPHVVGDGDDSATRSLPESQASTEPPAETPTVSMPTVERAPGAEYEHGSIPDGAAANLPVRYAATASTEVARSAGTATTVQTSLLAVEPSWDDAVDGPADGSTRTGSIVVGDLLVHVNAPDGTSVGDCPADRRPQPSLIAPDASARPRATGGHLLERDALCDRLRDRLGQGRCVRLTGPAGSGRTAVLDTVAAACAGVAPAGVVQLSGYRRTAADLLQELFAATYRAPGYRPGRDRLPALLRGVGAVVVVDDIEFGAEALEELLSAAPECAFLVSATPDVSAPVASSRMEEVTIPGLSRQASLSLLARLAGRSLDETERAWAVDLWFESEGLPLRFVQAGALLRHREAAIEALAAGLPGPDWEGIGPVEGVELLDTQRVSGTLVDPAAGPRPTPGGFDAYVSQHESVGEPPPDPVPLPSVAESAAPAVRIARGLSDPARRTLRLATALGGECPTAPHLPALVDVGHGEAALEELVEAGLAVATGVHHRLVDGVCELLADEWPGSDAAREAGQHFVWWTGHASVTPEQIADEAEVLLAAMRADREAGRHAKVVLLARAAAPSFALSLRWGAWERALRFGLESARVTGAVAEEAWFHHELGVLGLCVGAYDRSRAELEASIALRAALGDVRAASAGRTTLALLEGSMRALTAGPVVLAAAGPPRGGLRRLAGRSDRAPGDDAPVSRRQIAAAVAGVVLMGALGSGIALAVGAFRHPDNSAGVKTVPVVTQTGAPSTPGGGSAGPGGASGSASASASSPGAVGAPQTQPAGATPDAGATATTTPSPSTTPSPPQSSAPVTPPPTHASSPPPTKSPTVPPPTTPPPTTPPPTTPPPTTPPPTTTPPVSTGGTGTTGTTGTAGTSATP